MDAQDPLCRHAIKDQIKLYIYRISGYHISTTLDGELHA
jgi:hypothetical protein